MLVHVHEITFSFLWALLFFLVQVLDFPKLDWEKANLIQICKCFWRDIVMEHVITGNFLINFSLKIVWENVDVETKLNVSIWLASNANGIYPKCSKIQWKHMWFYVLIFQCKHLNVLSVCIVWDVICEKSPKRLPIEHTWLLIYVV